MDTSTGDGAEMPFEEWKMTEVERREFEIQTRMYLEGARAAREEVAWLEEHNFPIWIQHEGKVIDARTLSNEVRARNKGRVFDLTRPPMLLRPLSER